MTKRWRYWARVYRHFAKDWRDICDFSERAAADMYAFESTGQPRIAYNDPYLNGRFNGYAVGKHWMDVTAAMWREDIAAGLLFPFELTTSLRKPGLRPSRALKQLLGTLQ